MNSLVGLGACTMITCAARFLWGWEVKKDRAMGFLVCCPHEKVGKSQKKEREGGRERKHLQKNPWILKTAHSTFHVRVCRLKYHVVIDCLPSGTFMGMEIS